jgi:hypothetical protein
MCRVRVFGLVEKESCLKDQFSIDLLCSLKFHTRPRAYSFELHPLMLGSLQQTCLPRSFP